MIKISFDYDGSLGHVDYLQELCLRLLTDGYNDVHIITRRFGTILPPEKAQYGIDGPDEFSEVLELADKLGVKRENVHFTNRQMKFETIKSLGINIHYDDDYEDLRLIRIHTNCIAFCV